MSTAVPISHWLASTQMREHVFLLSVNESSAFMKMCNNTSYTIIRHYTDKPKTTSDIN